MSIAEHNPVVQTNTLRPVHGIDVMMAVIQGPPKVSEFVVGEFLEPLTMDVDTGLTLEEQLKKDVSGLGSRWVITLLNRSRSTSLPALPTYDTARAS